MSNLLTGPASAVPGFTSLPPFPVGKGLSIIHTMQAMGVVYGLGSKPDPLSASPPTFAIAPGKPNPSVDCSGFHRYVIYHLAGGAAGGVITPDGSYAQNDWYAAQGFKHHVISQPHSPDYLQNIDPAYVYACFCKTGSRGETIGHVWIIAYVNGAWWTLESHGGSGPSSRPYDTPILSQICTDIYPIARAAT